MICGAAASAFSCLGGKIHGIGVDDEGLLTEQLQQIPKALMAYVSPSYQYPTGATLSMARRMVSRQHLSHIGDMPQVSSGLHVTIRLPSLEKEQQLITQALSAEIEITPLSASWLPGSPETQNGRYGLVLGFACVKVHDIVLAVETLKRVWPQP